MIDRELLFFKAFGEMGSKKAMESISMDMIFLSPIKDIGLMIWKMDKEDYFLKMPNILVTGEMIKNMVKEN